MGAIFIFEAFLLTSIAFLAAVCIRIFTGSSTLTQSFDLISVCVRLSFFLEPVR